MALAVQFSRPDSEAGKAAAAASNTATFTRDGEPVAVLLAGRPEMLPRARALLTGTTERTFA